jgi:hypothetical protein
VKKVIFEDIVASVAIAMVTYALKCILSTVLVIFAILFLLYGLFMTESRLPIPSPLLLILFLISISFLGYFESGQVAVVNLSVIDSKQSKNIAEKLPLTYRVYQLISGPGVVEKYLIGRQLCVIGLVFFISQLTSFPNMPHILPYGLEHILIKSGLPGVLVTLTVGQLFPQLLADEYTLRFLNLKGSLVFIKAATFIEAFGVFTHFSWLMSYGLIAWVFRWKDRPSESGIAMVTYNPIEAMELSQSAHNLLSWGAAATASATSALATATGANTTSPSSLELGDTLTEQPAITGEKICREEIEQVNPFKSGFFSSLGALFLFTASTFLTLSAMFFIIYGLTYNRPILEAPRPVLFVLFVLCTLAEFYLEGSQVAVLAIQHKEITVLGDAHSGAASIHHLVNSEKNGVKRFLIGRQFLIVMSMFTVASLTTYQSYSQPFLPSNIISPLAFTGFFGVIFGLNTVQLPAQMIAKQYPISFLNLPGMKFVIQAALVVESTGLMHSGWVLFDTLKHLFIEDA